MKIVVAPDSFKDSLSAAEVADAIQAGLEEVFPKAQIIKCPMADGGEGTLDAVLASVDGERCNSLVTGPLGDIVDASWAWLPESHTAVIEMAEASGLQLVPTAKRNAARSSSRGTGELILEALDIGARNIVLTLGGSATNDAGVGMLEALGARFLNSDLSPLPPGGKALAALSKIDLSGLDPRLAEVTFQAMVDVDNPLCGPFGASHTYGLQKGATQTELAALDAALAHFADCCQALLGKDERDYPGSGAAGGLGFAARTFLQARFRPGIEMVADLVQLARHIEDADLVITGEGCCDAQSLRGKTPFGVARIARQYHVPVFVLAGTLGERYADLYSHGIDAAFSIASGPMTLDEACQQAPVLLQALARDIGRVFRLTIELHK
ncbi:glycerate kinase [Stutzerimonas degradans]|uniref:Glycerate kinase n=1 Tax=Stutzerimonas degradans TaxID=2968968 RepID=A0A8E2QB37_9GAMM|nr:glycerate kinase [Stutzerimonas degradans]MCQ4277053.1 glycerate kinase [Stutzerimonas degradans]PNF75083.1 glycerate kinase [Stutzerimonas degradans]QPT21563.1 glycerate kinase [Stutzerimonas degradans]